MQPGRRKMKLFYKAWNSESHTLNKNHFGNLINQAILVSHDIGHTQLLPHQMPKGVIMVKYGSIKWLDVFFK